MRKNKKLLLGGLSVLTLVAAGSGAVSTFAWFQVDAAGTTFSSAATGQIATVSNPYSVGGFTITPVIGAVSSAVNPTNDSGEVWYYVGTTLKEDTSPSNTYQSTTVGMTITYDNSTKPLTDAEVLAAWNALGIAKVHVDLGVTGKIKIAKSGAKAAQDGETIQFEWATNSLSFSSGVATLAAETFYYGISAETTTVETAGDRGTITAQAVTGAIS